MKKLVLFLCCLSFILSSCTSIRDARELPDETEIVGEVSSKTIIPRILFTSFKQQNKKRIAKALIKKAKKKYGNNIDLYLVSTDSSWNVLSLLLYFDCFGFVETVEAKAIVVKSEKPISTSELVSHLLSDTDKLPKLEKLPIFNDTENAYVFELPNGVSDNIVFYNKSKAANFHVTLFSYIDNRKWEQVTSKYLSDNGDRATTWDFSDKFNQARYYAIINDSNFIDFSYNIYEDDDDLVIEVLNGKKIEQQTTEKQSIEKQETKTEIVQPFKMTYTKELKNTDEAFINTKIRLAEIYNSAKNVIQVEDKDYCIIVGKAKTSDDVHYTFKTHLKGNMFTIEYYDFYYTLPILGSIALETKRQYDIMKEKTDELAASILSSLN